MEDAVYYIREFVKYFTMLLDLLREFFGATKGDDKDDEKAE